MRGTPFLKESFVGGLNTIDSPYTIPEGESRECLNVVSTTKGAIRKRTGSLIYASGAAANPTEPLTIKDSFKRGKESPLSNANKWSKVEVSGALAETGEVGGGEKWDNIVANKYEGGYWNEAEQTNPSVTIELAEKITSTMIGSFSVLACVDATAKKFYAVRAEERAAGTEEFTVSILKDAALTSMATATRITFKPKDKLGITVRNEQITAWRYISSETTWTSIISFKDASYTKGFSGFLGRGEEGHLIELNNFSSQEASIAPAESEFISLLPCMVSSGNYLIANSGTKIFSVNEKREITDISKEAYTEGERWSIVQAPKGTLKTGGPVYLTNGKDKPQTWSGAAKGTVVTTWEGEASAPESKEGVLPAGQRIIKDTGKHLFLVEDVGRSIEFKSVVKQKANSTTITSAVILRVLSNSEAEVAIDSEGWEKEYTTVEYKILRNYYEDATTKEHVPNGKYSVFHQNRIYMAGMSDDESAVRFSGLATIGEGGVQCDPTAWPKENVVRFEPSSNEPITGLHTVGPYVVVFKARGTWVIHNLDTGENRQLSDTIGCSANRSIQEVPGGIMFLTEDQGVYFTNGSKMTEMSYKVKPTLLSMNEKGRKNAAAVYFNNRYIISFPSEKVEKSDKSLEYDFTLKSWWLHDIACNQWAAWTQSTETQIFGVRPKAKDGILKCFVKGVYQDAGINYTGEKGLTAFWLSHWEPFAYYIFRHRIKAPFLKKRMRAIFLNGTGEITPIIAKNFISPGTEEGGVVGNNPMETIEKPVKFSSEAKASEKQSGTVRLYALGVGSVWSVGFGNASAEPFEVDSYAYFVQFRKS